MKKETPRKFPQPNAVNSPLQRGTDRSGTPSAPFTKTFPIVGIGASAGGLEALEMFLRSVPPKSGMAFVIVQHLDPTHKGIMVELLQRASFMPVVEVTDRLRIKPDCVYVIPPNQDMSILHGALYLLAPVEPRGLRLPIDFFFRSLAVDQQDRSIGVILSGMGSDGTLGLRAIKEKAGIVFVQEPASAKFDGMPRSAIDAGLADVVAAAGELPARIIAFLRYAPRIIGARLAQEDKTQSELEKVVILLRERTGNDFSQYKKSTIYRRLERRMGVHQIDKIATYVRFLRENPQEVELLFRELLIGVTSFFRDPAAWDSLKSEVVPAMLADRPSRRVLRAWVPACSTGEEAYSLAIVFQETLERIESSGNFSLQIFATDLDRDAIDKARRGLYPANIAADVSAERLRRFFVQEEQGYRVNKTIREMVIFATQNLVRDPPFTKLDILTCRNLLIYLSPEMQKKLLPLFHFSLNSGGILFLGNAESVGSFSGFFSQLGGKSRIYRRVESALRAEPVEFPPSFASLPVMAPPNPPPFSDLKSMADHILLQSYSPAAVLVNDTGDILYINGRTGKYLEPAAGHVNWNILAMAREGLRLELNAAFARVRRQKDKVVLSGVKVKTDGDVQGVDVTIQPLAEPEPLRGKIMVVFRASTIPMVIKSTVKTEKASVPSSRLAPLTQELLHLREELLTTREEMQTSQEELKSANEELQSTNEELMTSKEEMQSLNEELQTVNTELQVKVDDLARANNDMKNLLNSTDIATLFLDYDLNVRRFTCSATRIINLIPGDVGRPVTDIASDLIYPELVDDSREVLRTLVFIERQVKTRDGRWFVARLMPYRTLENKIDGMVITFIDISKSKTLETELRNKQIDLEQRLENKVSEREPVDETRHKREKSGRDKPRIGNKKKSVETSGGHHEKDPE